MKNLFPVRPSISTNSLSAEGQPLPAQASTADATRCVHGSASRQRPKMPHRFRGGLRSIAPHGAMSKYYVMLKCSELFGMLSQSRETGWVSQPFVVSHSWGFQLWDLIFMSGNRPQLSCLFPRAPHDTASGRLAFGELPLT